jgi:hypothetical protein
VNREIHGPGRAGQKLIRKHPQRIWHLVVECDASDCIAVLQDLKLVLVSVMVGDKAGVITSSCSAFEPMKLKETTKGPKDLREMYCGTEALDGDCRRMSDI